MGEIAALATSFMWAVTSIQFTLASHRIGSEVVNRTRLVLAVVYLALVHLLLQGELWPMGVEFSRWGWLGASALIGLVLGDTCLFQAFILIGPRRATLVATLGPVIGALVAWGFLGETLKPAEIGGVLLTVAGIAWVVSEKQPHQAQATVDQDEKRKYTLGVLLAALAALGQATGLVLSKRGLEGDFSPLSATLIRMIVASAGIWLFALARGQVGETWQALRDRRGWWFTVGGSLTGPFVGVWLSMLAVQNAPVGIASTLMSLTPVILIPVSHHIFHEYISLRSIAGTFIALAGVAIIFLT